MGHRSDTYFASYKPYFWVWEEDGEVISIPEGNTIAYREFIDRLITSFEGSTLPPFGSLLLAVLATNPDASEALQKLRKIMVELLGTADNTVFSECMDGLEMLARVPAEYKTGKTRLQLIRRFFYKCHNGIAYQKIYRQLRNIKAPMLYSEAPKPYEQNLFYTEFRVIAIQAATFIDEFDLLTSIAQLPQVSEENALDTLAADSFIPNKPLLDSLLENEKTFPIASLVKQLWAGFLFPDKQLNPSDMAQGGVNDLSNKGDYDKLLIAEHANEEWVFLSRLANHEALFLKRETPPVQQKRKRSILIDMSLRSWGSPRLIAYALAISLLEHPKDKCQYRVFALGDTCKELEMSSVEKIISSVSLLSLALHPAAALKEYASVYALPGEESLLISTSEACKDPQFLLAAEKELSSLDFSVYVESTGLLRLFAHHASGKKCIQELQLPLQQLWKQDRKGKKDKDLPLNDRRDVSDKHRFDLLLPHSPNYRYIFSSPDKSLFMVDKRGRLLKSAISDLYNTQYKGWIVLSEKIPEHSLLADIGLHSSGTHFLLSYSRQKGITELLNLDTLEVKKVAFTSFYSVYAEFFFFKDRFYYVSPKKQWSFDPVELHVKEEFGPLSEELEKEANFAGMQRKSKVRSMLHFPYGILKNVDNVYINQQGLVLGRHLLSVYKVGHSMELKMKERGSEDRLYEARFLPSKQGRSIFEFADGSKVDIYEEGIARFTSSSQAILPFSMTCIVDQPISMGNEEHFAGHEFFKLHSHSKTISVSEFYSLYFATFIEHIIQHSKGGTHVAKS